MGTKSYCTKTAVHLYGTFQKVSPLTPSLSSWGRKKKLMGQASQEASGAPRTLSNLHFPRLW